MFKKNDIEKPISDFHDRDSLRKALQESGLSDSAAHQFADLGRYSLHLRPIQSDAGANRVFSKIGGIPDLPAGVDWPIRPGFPAHAKEAPKGLFRRILDRVLYARPSDQALNYRANPQPYNFIAQIAFKEMAPVGSDELELPDTGALYLFYDGVSQCWGFDPEDHIGFKVIYVADLEATTQATRPDFCEDVPRYTEVLVEPTRRFEHSRYEGRHFDDLQVSDDEKETYIQFDEMVEASTRLGVA